MVKKISTYVLIFILIIIFTSSIITTILNFTVFNENYVVSILRENQYYSKTYNTIIEKFKDNTVQSGLEENVLEGIISEKKIEEDTLIIIKNIYENDETKVDTEIVKTRLKEKIDEIISNNKKKVTNEEQEAINTYLNTIEDIYIDGILYKLNYIELIKNISTKILEIKQGVIVIEWLIVILLFIIIVLINKEKSIKYYSISLISSGILLFVPKIIESIHFNIHNVLLFNLNFSNTIISIVENVFISMMICGTICVVIGILLNIFNINDKKEEKKIIKF